MREERTEKEARRLIQFHNSSGSSEKKRSIDVFLVQITRIAQGIAFFYESVHILSFFFLKEKKKFEGNFNSAKDTNCSCPDFLPVKLKPCASVLAEKAIRPSLFFFLIPLSEAARQHLTLSPFHPGNREFRKKQASVHSDTRSHNRAGTLFANI